MLPRFYVNVELAVDQEVALPTSVSHHVLVLRLKLGDSLILFNGQRGEYTAMLIESSKRQSIVRITHYSNIERESELRVCLTQAVCSVERLDWVLQKVTELGVAEIQLIKASRSPGKINEERIRAKMPHWHNIIISACEQSGRTRVPLISSVGTLEQALFKGPSLGRRFILLPNAQTSLLDFRDTQGGSVSLLVGPEGGFTDAEENVAIEKGWQPVGLGPRILRVETAAIAAVVMAQGLWGDCGGNMSENS